MHEYMYVLVFDTSLMIAVIQGIKFAKFHDILFCDKDNSYDMNFYKLYLNNSLFVVK